MIFNLVWLPARQTGSSIRTKVLLRIMLRDTTVCEDDLVKQALSLSRLNHWLPRCQAEPEVMQGTADFHHDITDALLPQADPVFDDATTLDAAVNMLDPQ